MQSCGFVFWLIFDNITCILHHFAFLFGCQFAVFSVPIICFLPLKSHVLTAILPISATFLITQKGFIYTTAVYLYAFCLAFSSILPCVQHQNALHLAPKRTPFSRKQPRNSGKWQLLHINIHSAACTCQPYFASKQIFARIDYLRSKGQLVDKTGTQDVKNCAEKWTKAGEQTRQLVNPKPSCAARLPPSPLVIAFYLQGMQYLMMLHGHIMAAG